MQKERLIELIDETIQGLKLNQEHASRPELYQFDEALSKLEHDDAIKQLFGGEFQTGVGTVRRIIELEKDFVLPQNGAKQSKTDSLIAFLENLKHRWFVLNVICRII